MDSSLKKKIIAIIPARSGSRGLRNKNIKLLGGHPLLGWAISACRKSKLIDYILVSTDSKKYAKLFRLANGYIHETIDLNFVASVKMIQFTSRDLALKKSEFYYLDGESEIMSYMGDKKDSDFVTAECKPFADDLDPEWYLINAALENRKKQMEKNIF